MPSGEVILYYMENGSKSRYVYAMKHEVVPARECVHRYDREKFSLISFDTTHPYWYSMQYEPVRKWNPKTKRYDSLIKKTYRNGKIK